MKKLKLVLLIAVISGIVSAQSKMALGLFGGSSWYMGDINPDHVGYALSPAAGAIFLYSFNKRWALRTQSTFIHLRTGSNKPNLYYSNSSFNTSIMQIDTRMEFNFRPFEMHDRKKIFSPYVNAGLGYTIPMGGSATNIPTLPFAVGMKLSLTRRMAVGCEWIAVKTFSDKLDGIENPGHYSSPFHHNDWFTCAGLFVVYKIFDNSGDCPVYW